MNRRAGRRRRTSEARSDDGDRRRRRASRSYLPMESRPIFTQGIILTLSRWAALQMAVDYAWGGPNTRLKAEQARPIFREGIILTLSRWAALQMAVDYAWGGPNTRLKAEQLVDKLFVWFTQSRELNVEVLEDSLVKFMLSLYTDVDYGSIEEVADKLMILLQECLEGNYTSVENLSAQPRPAAVSHVRQKLYDDEDDCSDDVGDEIQGVGHQLSMMMEGKSLPTLKTSRHVI